MKPYHLAPFNMNMDLANQSSGVHVYTINMLITQGLSWSRSANLFFHSLSVCVWQQTLSSIFLFHQIKSQMGFFICVVLIFTKLHIIMCTDRTICHVYFNVSIYSTVNCYQLLLKVKKQDDSNYLHQRHRFL